MGRLIFPKAYENELEKKFMEGDLSRFYLCYPWIDRPYMSWDDHKGDIPYIEIRRFIELSCTSDVAIVAGAHSEFYTPPNQKDKFNPFGYQVSFAWKEFWFEEEKDYIIFKLRFGKPDIVDAPTVNLTSTLDKRKDDSHTVPRM